MGAEGEPVSEADLLNARCLQSAQDAFQFQFNEYDDPDSPLQLPEVTKTFDWEAVARQLGIRFVSVDPGVTGWITAYTTDAFFDTRKCLSSSPIPSDTTRQRIHNKKFCVSTSGYQNACGYQARASFLSRRLSKQVSDRRRLSLLRGYKAVDESVLLRGISDHHGAFDCGRRVYDSMQHRR